MINNLSFSKSSNDRREFDVSFNNIKVGTADDNYSENGKYYVNFSLNFINLSTDYSIKNILDSNIGMIILPLDINKFKNLDWSKNNFTQSALYIDFDGHLSINIIPDFLKWNKTLSIHQLIDKLKPRLISHGMFQLYPDNEENLYEEGYYFDFKYDETKSLKNEYEKYLILIDNEVESVFNEENYLIHAFNFPSEIKSSCEQYLIYFSKFLEDMGIESLSIIDSKVDTTYFKIKPKDSNEALSKINELLNIYLSLPNNPDLDNISLDYTDVSVAQLMSNIHHLKSQLYLANSIIELKDSTIESLKLTNYQKDNIIANIPNNEEKTLDGLITIKEYEYYGMKLNLPEIFRRLKRKILK